MIGEAHQYMKGDVTFIETYIRFVQLVDDYNARNGLFKRKADLPIESIIAMHETFSRCQQDTTTPEFSSVQRIMGIQLIIH